MRCARVRHQHQLHWHRSRACGARLALDDASPETSLPLFQARDLASDDSPMTGARGANRRLPFELEPAPAVLATCACRRRRHRLRRARREAPSRRVAHPAAAGHLPRDGLVLGS